MVLGGNGDTECHTAGTAGGSGYCEMIRSSGIDGGVSRRIAKGDVVIIPGGVPHMWVSVESDVTYLVVRPDPDKKIPVK